MPRGITRNEFNENLITEFNNLKRGVNVKDFGAVGNGITDDTSAIQSAIDYLRNIGGIVYIPRGIYIISNYITQYSDISIIGEGMGKTIVQVTNDADYKHVFKSYVSENPTYLEIKDITLVGTGTSASVQNGNAGRPIVYDYAENVVIERVEARWFRGLGITTMDCKDVTISDCVLQHIGRDGISTSGSRKLTITNNKLKYIGDDAIANHSITGHINPTPIPSARSGLTVISGNVCEHTGAISSVCGQDVIISDNILRFIRGIGIDFNTSTQEGSNIGNVQDIKIHNNTLIDSFSASGDYFVRIVNRSTTSTGHIVSGSWLLPEDNEENPSATWRVSISNNKFIQRSKAGTYKGDWTAQEDYYLNHKHLYGIYLCGFSEDMEIKNNTFYRVGTAVYQAQVVVNGSPVGIPYGLVFSNNRVIRCDSGINIGNAIDSNTYNCRNEISNNYFDIDPYHELSARYSDGSWNMGTITNYCAFYDKVNGTVFKNNIIRNIQSCFSGLIGVAKNNLIYYGTVGVETLYAGSEVWNTSKKIFEVGNPLSDDFGKTYSRYVEYWSDIPTLQTWLAGDRIYNSAPSAGKNEGWICTTSGTQGTLSGITGSINSGENTLTVNSLTGLMTGRYITIAGVTGTKIITKIVGNILTLNSNSDATVTNVSVALSNATFRRFGFIEYVTSVTFDPPSLTTGTQTSTVINTVFCVLGDRAIATFSLNRQGIQLWAEVTATNTVTVYFRNDTGSTIDLGSGTLRVDIIRQ